MKKLLTLALALVLVLSLAACGNDTGKTPSGSTGTDNSQQSTNQPSSGSDDKSGIAWPSNHYTDMIPKPENIVIYSEKAIDNAYYIGHDFIFEKWTIEDCRAYVAKLQEAGWTTPGDGMDAVIIKDTAEDFEFGAYNADHVFVTGNAHAANNSGGLSIYNLKQDLEEE